MIEKIEQQITSKESKLGQQTELILQTDEDHRVTNNKLGFLLSSIKTIFFFILLLATSFILIPFAILASQVNQKK